MMHFPNSLLLGIFVFLPNLYSEILFTKEDITMCILNENTVEISGIYWFTNTTDSSKGLSIYFPFAIDSISNYPDFISLQGASGAIAYARNKDGINWQMYIPGKKTDSVHLIYRQHTQRQEGKYIVMTALSWNRPLVTATFTLKISPKYVLSYYTFTTDSITVDKDTLTYTSKYKNFIPERDLVFRWNTIE